MGKSHPARSRSKVDDRKSPIVAAAEVRRSGRANKGVNKSDRWQEVIASAKRHIVDPNNPDEEETDEETTEKEEMQQQGDAEQEVIRCVCGQTGEVEDDDKTFIQCESCSAWQHAPCVGIGDDKIPEQYFCEICRPGLHVQLLKDIEEGKFESVLPSLKRKRGQKGKTTETLKKPTPKLAVVEESVPEQNQETPMPDDDATQDFIEPPPSRSPSPLSASDSEYESDGVDAVRTKARRVSAGNTIRPARFAKSDSLKHDQGISNHKPPARKQSRNTSNSHIDRHTADEPYEDLNDIADPVRKSVAKALQIDVAKAISLASGDESYALKSEASAEETSQSLGFAIEFALFKEYPESTTGKLSVGQKYKDKYRTIAFNLKDSKNPLLRKRVLDGELLPRDLVKMASEDMANPEVKALAEAVRVEGLKQSVLVQETGPRIRRTHKGEELVEVAGNTGSTAVEASSTPFPVSTPLKEPEEAIPAKSGDGSNASAFEGRHFRKSSGQAPANSPSFDIKNVWSNIDSPKESSKAASPPATNQNDYSKRASDRFDVDTMDAMDADLHSMIDDEGNNTPPYSPSYYLAPADTETLNSKDEDLPLRVVWEGELVMQNVTKFNAKANLVGGPDDTVSWGEIFVRSSLMVEGRIAIPEATKYLTHQRFSNSKTVLAVSFTADAANLDAFDTLYNYFEKRQRYGVIKSGSSRVRDAYMIPLSPEAPVPEYVELMDKHHIKPDRKTKLLLGVMVINKSSSDMPPNFQRTASVSAPLVQTLRTSSPREQIPSPMSPHVSQTSNATQKPGLQAGSSGPGNFGHPSPLQSSQIEPPASGVPNLSDSHRLILEQFLRAHPEVATNPDLVSNPQILARLLMDFQERGV